MSLPSEVGGATAAMLVNLTRRLSAPSPITDGSKLADANEMATSVPAGNRTSRYSMSFYAKRAVPRTAPR